MVMASKNHARRIGGEDVDGAIGAVHRVGIVCVSTLRNRRCPCVRDWDGGRGGTRQPGGCAWSGGRAEACLLDSFGTILACDSTAHIRELWVLAGVPAGAMYEEFALIAPALTDGRLSLGAGYCRIFRACGAEPRPECAPWWTEGWNCYWRPGGCIRAGREPSRLEHGC